MLFNMNLLFDERFLSVDELLVLEKMKVVFLCLKEKRLVCVSFWLEYFYLFVICSKLVNLTIEVLNLYLRCGRDVTMIPFFK